MRKRTWEDREKGRGRKEEWKSEDRKKKDTERAGYEGSRPLNGRNIELLTSLFKVLSF
jgi:hypothetical protein